MIKNSEIHPIRPIPPPLRAVRFNGDDIIDDKSSTVGEAECPDDEVGEIYIQSEDDEESMFGKSPRDRRTRRAQEFVLKQLHRLVSRHTKLLSEDEANDSFGEDSEHFWNNNRIMHVITPEKTLRRSVPFTNRILYNFERDNDLCHSSSDSCPDLPSRGTTSKNDKALMLTNGDQIKGDSSPPSLTYSPNVKEALTETKLRKFKRFFVRRRKDDSREFVQASENTATTATTATTPDQTSIEFHTRFSAPDGKVQLINTTSNTICPSPLSSTTYLSSWKSEWGPGQQLMRHSRRRWLFFQRDPLDRPKGSFLEAIRTFRRLSKPLRREKISHLLKAVRALGSLQEAASDPYPPKNILAVDLNSTGGQVLMHEIHFHFILSVAVYPPEHVNKHYGMNVEATNMVEFAREILTGRPDGKSDDVVIVDYLEKAAVNRPAYCLLVDHSRQRILLIIRGSVQFSDIATDVQCEILPHTRTHDGFERAASWFDENLRSIIIFLRRSFSSYTVGLCGHSLGGAVASILCMRWLNYTEIAGPPPSRPMLKAYSFGAPCVCTQDVTNGRDIVSRLSSGSVENMAQMLLHICENTRLKKNNGNRKQEIKDGVKDARKACSDANHIGRTRKTLASHELLDVVHDAAEYLESLLEQKSEDASKFADNLHSAMKNRLSKLEKGQTAVTNECGVSEPLTSNETLQGLHENCDFVDHPVAHQSSNREVEKECEHSKRQRCKNFLLGMKTARKPLLQLLNEFRRLQVAEEHTILVPAGQWYMFIPALHFLVAGRPLPAHLGPGGYGMFDVSQNKAEICKEMVFRRRAIVDHFPYYINFALGCPLGMNIPDDLANEMERSLSMGVDFSVRPQWNIPHFGLRHRRLRLKQTHNVNNHILLPAWAARLRDNTVALPKYVVKMINHNNYNVEDHRSQREDRIVETQPQKETETNANSTRDLYDNGNCCKLIDVSYHTGGVKK